MNQLDLNAAAAHARVHELRDAASASRLAARAACARSDDRRLTGRVRAALRLQRDCG